MVFAFEDMMNFMIPLTGVPIILSYFNTFLIYRSQKGKVISCIIWIIYWLFDGPLIQDRIVSILWRAIYTIGIWTVICFILYKNEFKTIILVTVSFYCMSIISESFIGFILIGFKINFSDFEIMAWIASKIILVMITQVIRVKHKSKMEGAVSLNYWLFSVLIPLGSIFIIYAISDLVLKLKDTQYSIMTYFALFVLLIMNVIIFSVYDGLQKEATIRQQNVVYEQQAQMYKLQSEEREAVWLEMRKFGHDYKNHLICLKEYASNLCYDKMDEYLSTLIESYQGDYWKDKSGNMVVDSLLSYKMSKAENGQIKFHTQFEIPHDMPFEDADICIIVGNAIDNAIEAVSIVDKELREINIGMRFERNVLVIEISNPYVGEIKSNKIGEIITSKSDKQNHGIGISSMQRTIKKYDGTLKINKNNDYFKLNIIMYGKANNDI